MKRKIAVTYRDARKVEPYEAALRLAGLEPVRIPPGHTGSFDGLRGLLLSGGTDVDPELYGQARHPETQHQDQERDELERSLLGLALERNLPVLAICRGMQLVNVALGGTLEQHIAGHSVRTADPSEPVHRVIVEPGSRLAGIVGPDPLAVNSRHHQAVREVARNLRVSARSAPDGVVEALERPASRFLVAVQWHPEDQAGDARQRRLFDSFAEALGK